ncbi:hypothetical protein SLEP1_g17148 [Rubroshorea leprosula]|uniref:BED-type domain-containing protein n=1 Tax=Rubroshorea leprosula TaxID=152421 RepID=A0AAV5J2J3_9ROSI|nr:hypothetical protein SLEP1_g17148 [Rubroshorea leprosula]
MENSENTEKSKEGTNSGTIAAADNTTKNTTDGSTNAKSDQAKSNAATAIGATRPSLSVQRKPMKRKVWVWKFFDEFTDENGKTRAWCHFCDCDLAAESRTNGTTPLKNHYNSCKMNHVNVMVQQILLNFQKVLEVDDVDGREVTQLTTTSRKFDEQAVRKVLAKMLIVDELPFSSVEHPGFVKFCQVACPLFNIASRRTITRDILSIYSNMKEDLKTYFKNGNQRVSLTTDTWTSLQRASYMCVTAHWIDANCWLRKKIQSFVPVDSHKGDALGDMLERCLREWGIDKVYCVTLDNASANDGLVRHLKGCLQKWGTSILGGQDLHMRCAAHIINLVVNDGFKEMQPSVNAVRAAVRYVRESPMRQKLFFECAKFEKIECEKMLSLDTPTRWNSLYLILEVAEKYELAFGSFARRDAHYEDALDHAIPTHEDWENCRKLVDFLGHFYCMTLKVSGNWYATSNLYFLEICSLDALLKEWEELSDIDLVMLTIKMRDKFDKYWETPVEMNKNIFIGMVLDPRYKLDKFGQLVKDETYKLFEENKKRIQGVGTGSSNSKSLSNSNVNSSGENSVSSVTAGGSSVSTSVEMNPSQRWQEKMKMKYKKYNNDNGATSEQSELNKYLAEAVEKDNPDLNILAWWKLNSPRFPVLGAMAKDVLAVRISTVASESCFSTSGRVLDAFRSSLTPKTVQALICAQDWLKPKGNLVFDEEDLDNLLNIEPCVEKLGLEVTLLGC